MKTRRNLSLLLLLLPFFWCAPIDAQHPQQTDASRIVFFVQWYDVGKAALAGLPGVYHVSSGFSGFREINTVMYDPRLISPEEMIDALKQAKTYIGVARE